MWQLSEYGLRRNQVAGVSAGRQVGPFLSHSPGLELSLWTSLGEGIESFILSFVGFNSFHPWLLLAVYSPR